MASKHREHNQEIAEKLGTTEKVISYVRPRLLEGRYKNLQEVFESLTKKIVALDKQLGYLEVAIKRRTNLIHNDKVNQEVHKKKLEGARIALKQNLERKKFLAEVGSFISKTKKSEKNIKILLS